MKQNLLEMVVGDYIDLLLIEDTGRVRKETGAKYRELESKKSKFLKYLGMGIAGLGVLTPLTLAIGVTYRALTDRCATTCGVNQLCRAKCHLQACDIAIRNLKQAYGQVKVNKADGGRKNRALKKIEGRINFYMEKRRIFQEKVKALTGETNVLLKK